MNLLIIYDNFASAAYAKANLERAAQLAGDAPRGKVELCRADSLKQSAFATRMMEEAADARLIVLALARYELASVWLFDWLEAWAARREVRDATLAVFEDEWTHDPSSGRAELSQFAWRHGLSFIGERSRMPDGVEVGRRSLSRRGPSRRFPKLIDSPPEPVQESLWHWGINE